MKYREKIISEKLKYNILITFLFILTIIFCFSSEAFSIEKINISGGRIDYNSAENTTIISGDVKADYGKYHFHAEEVIIENNKEQTGIMSSPENIKISPGDITGCDTEKPHYYFRAQKIRIKPNDYLEAYNIVFYELNGKLPLFYLPYLYISLSEERQRLVTEFGYSSTRGWFGKLTFNYTSFYELPGQIYFDYYQKTGEAYGFKQHFINNKNHQGYFYYYTQENNIGLSNLFDTHFAFQYDYEKDNIVANNRVNYKYFNKYDLLEGIFEVDYQNKDQNIDLDVNYEKYDYNNDNEDKEINDISFDINRDFANDLSINADYNLDSVRYFESIENDEKEMEMALNLEKSFENNLDIGIDLEQNLDYDYGQNIIEERTSREYNLNYNWLRNWSLNSNYGYEELKETDENLKSREYYESILTYRYSNLRIDTILEREDPAFSEEDEVSFYRLPEIKLTYNPRKYFEYKLQVGNYYEDDSGTRGYRGAGNVNYSRRFRVLDNTSFNVTQEVIGRVYDLKTETENTDYNRYQGIYNSDLGMENNFTDRLTFNNNYKLTLFRGDSPFEFDQAEFKEEIVSSINYQINDLVDINLESGYDLYNREYLPLETSFKIWPLTGWLISLGTEYNLNSQEFEENLIVKSDYQTENVKANTEMEYDLNKNRLKTLENEISYEIPGDWGWYIENNISYDFEESVSDRLEKANLSLTKRLHCREVRFSYDYLNNEVIFAYSLDIFPGDDISLGRSDQEGFIFNFGLEDDLKSE